MFVETMEEKKTQACRHTRCLMPGPTTTTVARTASRTWARLTGTQVRGIARARAVLALAWTACVLWSGLVWFAWVPAGPGCPPWLVSYLSKLTHWTALVLLCSLYRKWTLSAAALRGRALPCVAAFDDVVSPSLPTTTLVVSLAFWIFVAYPTEDRYPPASVALAIVMHGGNFVVAWISDHLQPRPRRTRHVLGVLLYAGCYLAFSLVFHATGGRNENCTDRYIYAALDWDDPGGSALSLAALTGLLLAPACFAALTTCSMCWDRTCFRRVRMGSRV